MQLRQRKWILIKIVLLAALSSSASLGKADDSAASSRSAAGSRQTSTQVYQCAANGERIFSDHPCGADAVLREIAAPNRMASQEVRGPMKHSATRSGAHEDPVETDQEKRIRHCKKLRADRDRLDARLRAGYSGKEGERLRDRLRQLQSDYYESHCAG